MTNKARTMHLGDMARSPIVVEPMDCIALVKGKHTHISSLNATALTLVSFGNDQILVPAPTEHAKISVREGIQTLPTERRSMVKVIDENAELYSKTIDYLRPLEDQATGREEKEFCIFAREALYKTILGYKFQSAVLESRISHITMMLPVINKSVFKGESQYRLMELAHLATSFKGQIYDRLDVVAEVGGPKTRTAIENILVSDQYQELAKVTGTIGRVKRPKILFAELKKDVKELAGNKTFKKVVRAGITASELPGSPVNLGPIGELSTLGGSDEFFPLSIDLPNTIEYQIYEESIKAFDEHAKPPPNTIFETFLPLSGYSDHLTIDLKYLLKYGTKRRLVNSEKLRREALTSLRSAGRFRKIEDGYL